MPTFNQLINANSKCIKGRTKKRHKKKTPDLKGCPQKIAHCIKVTLRKPKKPNSAQRKIARVELSTKKKVTIYIPGQGHSLQPHSIVLVRGGRTKDLPGIKYKAIRGKKDFLLEKTIVRSSRRSKYGFKILRRKHEIMERIWKLYTASLERYFEGPTKTRKFFYFKKLYYKNKNKTKK